MDPTVWLVLAGLVAVFLGLATFIHFKTTNSPDTEKQSTGANSGVGDVTAEGRTAGEGRTRRPQARNVRARLTALLRAREAGPEGEREESREEGSEGEDNEDCAENEMFEKKGKVGTKKRKRIQEKEERKAAREQEEAMRKDRKEREALREEQRKREVEEEKRRLKKEEEEDRLKKKEEELKEQEEYMALKESFVVEEEGMDAKDEDTEARGIREFIDYIKRVKVVYMEDLGGEFGLKTQDAIARVQSLQDSGELSGVVDDRGKFIYISEGEMKAVALFIKQRGRVSITELVSSSNRLINLQPEIQST